MPFSSKQEAGLHIRIAEVISEALGADLSIVWVSAQDIESLLDHYLYTGQCDIVIGLQDGTEGFLHSAAFFRSPYAIATRSVDGLEVSSLEDPVLQNLNVAAMGAPAVAALRRIDLQNLIHWDVQTSAEVRGGYSSIVEALETGVIDVAVAWGPILGYFAKNKSDTIRVVPVDEEFYPPFIPMVENITIGVRPNDVELRDQLNFALARGWDTIQELLGEYGVPLAPLPRLLE